MHADWKRFLEGEGAHLTDERVHLFHVGDGPPDPGERRRADARLALDTDVLSDLSHIGRLRAAGPDAERFLQNQFTNDLRDVTPERGQLSGYCNPKGRLVAVFRIHRQGDAFVLWLPREGVGSVLERLTMYRLRSRVDLTDESDDGAAFGYSGPGALDELSARVGPIPDTIYGVTEYEVTGAGGVTIVRLPGPHARFALRGPVEALRSLWSELATDATPVGSGAWDLLDIQAGLPVVYPPTLEAFVPQMMNLDLVGGLSFTKGCFPGQEVVARLRYRGELKRRMYRAHAEGSSLPGPGTPVHHRDGADRQSAGKVVTAEVSPDGGVELLAVLTIGLTRSGELRLESEDGPPVTLLPLPYEIQADPVD